MLIVVLSLYILRYKRTLGKPDASLFFNKWRGENLTHKVCLLISFVSFFHCNKKYQEKVGKGIFDNLRSPACLNYFNLVLFYCPLLDEGDNCDLKASFRVVAIVIIILAAA